MAQLVEFLYWILMANYVVMGVLFADAVIRWLDFKPEKSAERKANIILLTAFCVLVWPWFIMVGLLLYVVEETRRRGL